MSKPRIMVAPNGARRGRADHPALPLTLPEILETARSCHSAGADALHLHVRDAEGRHSLDAGLYLETLAELRSVTGLEVQITTEAGGIYAPEDQFDCLTSLCPRWASVSVREIARDPEIVPRLYDFCASHAIRVQHILYDSDDLARLLRWRDRGVVVPSQNEVIFVLGAYTPPRAGEPMELMPLIARAEGLRFSLCAFGAQEQSCLLTAARAGADYLRVGFENNLTAPDGTPWADNAAAVASLRSELKRTKI